LKVNPTLEATSTDGQRLNTSNTIVPSAETPSITETLEVQADNFMGIILFVFGDGFDYSHYEGTRKSLERAGFMVKIASNNLGPIEGSVVIHSFTNIAGTGATSRYVEGDLLLKDVEVVDYMAIVFISDTGILSNPDSEVKRIINQAAEKGVVLAAQEFGVYLLANEGVLKGRKVTANPLICNELQVNYDAICTLMPVQRDSGIVTADPTNATSSFARAIMMEIENKGG